MFFSDSLSDGSPIGTTKHAADARPDRGRREGLRPYSLATRGKAAKELQDIVDAMSATFGEDKVKLDLWPSSLLGLTLTYHVDGSIGVGQQGYVDTLCERFSSYLTDKGEKYPHDGEGLRVRTERRLVVILQRRGRAYITSTKSSQPPCPDNNSAGISISIVLTKGTRQPYRALFQGLA